MQYPRYLLQLIESLKRLPGVGTRTAERYAFHVLSWEESERQAFAKLMTGVKEALQRCTTCGCLHDTEGCVFCVDSTRNQKAVCVLSSVKDVYAIEETGEYRGLYHVLDGLLSPLEGRGYKEVGLERLSQRIAYHQVQEVILAFDSTVDGDTTTLYVKQMLESQGVTVSRLAYGMPMGSPLDYIDGGTLALAFSGRRSV